jgi:hypothetical protein
LYLHESAAFAGDDASVFENAPGAAISSTFQQYGGVNQPQSARMANGRQRCARLLRAGLAAALWSRCIHAGTDLMPGSAVEPNCREVSVLASSGLSGWRAHGAIQPGARQSLLGRQGHGEWARSDSKWTIAASAGTITEGSIAVDVRLGRIESPWWAFAPAENTYVPETQPAPPPLARGSASEFFAFAGVRAKARVYNAFLEGQFRHSDYTYPLHALNPFLGEIWCGLEWRMPFCLDLQYLVRWESPELRSGIGSRSIVWGSLAMTWDFQQR